MNLTDMTIEEMCTTTEKQSFDRKSAKIEATAIATPMIAFANAKPGSLASKANMVRDYNSRNNK